MKNKNQNVKSYKIVIAIILFWVLILINSLFGVLALLFMIFYIVREGSWSWSNIALVFYLSPFVIVPFGSMFWGSIDYCIGKEKLKTESYYSYEFFLLDKKNRIPIISIEPNSGWIKEQSAINYSRAVRFFVSYFGNNKETYSGYFPYPKEAIKDIEEVSNKGFAKIDKNSLKILNENNKEFVDLDIHGFQLLKTMNAFEKIVPIKFRVVNDECLLIDYPVNFIFVADLKGKQIIAQYYKELYARNK